MKTIEQRKIDVVCKYKELSKIKVGQPCIVNGKHGVIVDAYDAAFIVIFEDGTRAQCNPEFNMTIK